MVNPGYPIAVLAASVYGAADFLGGYASRSVSAITVTFAAGVVGLVTLLVASPFVRGAAGPSDYAWAAAAGVCGGLGVALLYRAFVIGPVSVAAPMISLLGLAIPVFCGMAWGERPSPLALSGIGLAVCAFPLLSRTGSRDAAPRPSGLGVVPVAVASGILVGGFLVCLGRVSRDAGMAPLAFARLTTVVLFGAIVAVRREPAWPRRAARSTLAAGVLDALANIAYFVAVHLGAMAIVGTIVSLAPAITLLLARLVLRERWSRSQQVALVLAGAAIVCVSLG